MPEDKNELTTREQALRVARMLGCQGAHEHPNGWMPCASHEEYEAIKKGQEEYLKVLAAKKKKPLPKMVQRTKRLETKSDAYYENRADAVAISKARGCGGVRTVLLAGKKYYAVCNHKAPKRGWENLDEKPITGIATLPGGGLVTGSFSGKSLGRPIGGVAEFDGDGDGFSTGPDGEDNIPTSSSELPEKLTTEMLKKMQEQVDPRYLDKDKSPQKNDGDFMMSAEEIMKLPAENYHNQPLLDPDTSEYLEDQRGKNAYGMNQRVRKEGVFYPIILRKWKDGKITIFDGHHRLIAAYDNHPKFQVPYFLWEEEGNIEDEFTNFKPESVNKNEAEEKGFVNFVSRSTDPDTFSDPESARIRARNLGCIGIRRYTARDGKLVWLPCTNVSDYNRATGIRGDNSPIRNPRRQGSGFKKKSETEEKALGRSIGGYRRMFKPIGGIGALEDGDGDGFATGLDGEDNVPVAKVPKPKNKKPAPKKKAPKKKLTPQQQRDLDKWNEEVARLRRLRLANAIPYDKAKEVWNHWSSTIDSMEKDSGISNDDKDYAKKKRIIMRRAYVASAKKFNLSPKQVQQHINERGRQERLPYVVTPEELGVRDIMLVRGAKPSQKDALTDGIFFNKVASKPKKIPPSVSSADINNLAIRVRQHNAKAKPAQKTNLRDLKTVYLRGLADGDRSSASKRISQFLSLLLSDKPKDVKYSDDNDLLPLDHPWRNRKTNKKWAGFDDGEYGIKYKEKCCPQIVKRHYAK